MLSMAACSVSKDKASRSDWAVIGLNGAGLLTHHKPFDLTSLQKSFPGAVLSETEIETYGKMDTVISVTPQDETAPLFYISFHHDYDQDSHPRTSVFAVFTRHPDVKGPGGAKVGFTRLKDIRPHIELSCKFGYNQLVDTYVCLGNNPVLGGLSFRALFVAPDGWRKPFSEAPIDLRKDGVLSEMMYYPRR